MAHTSGYLPSAGPVPLRFHMAASLAAAPPAPLPPLQMSTPLPPLSEEVPALSATTNVVVEFPQPPGEFGPQMYSIPATENGGASTNEAETVKMTPQMLMQFFQQQQQPQQPAQKPGNGASTSVLVPLNFTPPQPVLPPSSSATYNSR